jgi:MFS transporter, PAT family, beta-lactamase induction signal transducer AmpG
VREPRSTSPITIFFLVLPWGISTGFLAYTLPHTLVHGNGLNDKTIGFILAVGILPNVMRVFWGPMVELTFTLRRWYAFTLIASSVMLLLLALIAQLPYFANLDKVVFLSVVFLSQVAATMTSVPVGGLMADTVAEHEKDRAAGCFQGGWLAGTSLGGAGIWLTDHSSIGFTGAVLSAAMMSCAGALYFVPDVRSRSARWSHQMRDIGRDFRDMLRSPITLLAILLIASPVGVGAATNHWTAIAKDWHAEETNWVTCVIILSCLTGAVGGLIGGWFADNVGPWRAYFGSGLFMVLVGIIIAVAPSKPNAFATGVLFYGFSLGLANAAFSALALHVIGGGSATTKYALLSSIANLPLTYMTLFDGWAHDGFLPDGLIPDWNLPVSSARMLNFEALLSLGCILLGLLALLKIKNTNQLRP